ncbi:HeH/LEM domain-containing protein [Streptococcus sp. IMAU11622]|uniref:HeH/LEM domain-containing protein n=1 Tax=Streptococcus sp. IMAU11622 TaxID=3332597 RepID=UPI0039F07554
MALYRDTKTGAVISSDSLIGGDWVPVGDTAPSGGDMTVAELKSSLDELGIDYDKSSKKSDLVALYEENKS